MPASVNDKFRKTTSGTRPESAYLTAQKTIGANTVSLNSTTGWPTDTGMDFVLYRKDTNNNVVPGSVTTWRGTVSGTTVNDLMLVAGTEPATGYPAGELSVAEMMPTANWSTDLVAGILEFANQDATLKTSAVQAALGLTNLNGYTPLGYTPNTITFDGNGSYKLTYNGVDLTNVLSPGMRKRLTRTVAAPTKCTSLNGTNQSFSKTSPVGMTWTDDFAAGAWVKLTSYGSTSAIISRYNGTSGWALRIESDGTVRLLGYNGGATNASSVLSIQSIPLNKWVHVVAQLDMSAFTTSTTTSYVMIDGVNVPAQVTRGGTSPISLIQAGNLEVGSTNASSFFSGKIAQAFVTSGKITQSQASSIYSQGITSSDISSLSMASAFSFDNSINDLNTTNANNLTANAGAVATNTDSPFTQQANGVPNGTDDHAIVMSATFSTNTTVTVQTPEGCTIPTSGGVSAAVYSSNVAPYGFPTQRDKWSISSIYNFSSSPFTTSTSLGQIGSIQITPPAGCWRIRAEVPVLVNANASATTGTFYFSTFATGPDGYNQGVRASNSSAINGRGLMSVERNTTLTNPTTHYFIGQTSTSGVSAAVDTFANTWLTADNAYL